MKIRIGVVLVFTSCIVLGCAGAVIIPYAISALSVGYTVDAITKGDVDASFLNTNPVTSAGKKARLRSIGVPDENSYKAIVGSLLFSKVEIAPHGRHPRIDKEAVSMAKELGVDGFILIGLPYSPKIEQEYILRTMVVWEIDVRIILTNGKIAYSQKAKIRAKAANRIGREDAIRIFGNLITEDLRNHAKGLLAISKTALHSK